MFRSVLALVLSLGLVLPGSALADVNPGISVVGIQQIIGSSNISKGSTRSVYKYAIVNHKNTPLVVTQLGVRFSGTALNSEITSATFTTLDVNGNVINLGSDSFNGANHRAVLTNAAGVVTIPAGETVDILVDVTVSGGAVTGNTAKFFLAPNLFSYTTPTPPDKVSVVADSESVIYTVVDPVPSSSLTLLSPNGGEIFNAGSSKVKISWSTKGMPVGWRIQKAELLKGANVVSTIFTPSGVFTLATTNWTIPAGTVVGNNYKIRVTAVLPNGSTVSDISDANFRIQ